MLAVVIKKADIFNIYMMCFVTYSARVLVSEILPRSQNEFKWVSTQIRHP